MVKIFAFIICAIKAFDPSIRPKCYITGQATEGWNQINSPSFPQPMPGRLDCLYALSAPKGKKIELLFEKFSLEKNAGCKQQGLAILDPAQTRSPGQTEMYCGSQKIQPFVSRGNQLYLNLNSKMNKSSEGFLIKYRIKGKGLDTSGPGGSPGTGTPMGVFGPKSGPTGSKPKPKSPARSPASRKGPSPKTPSKKGPLSVKQMIAKMAAASENTGKPKLKMSNKGRKGGKGSATMLQDCQEGWQPGMPCMQKKTKQLGSKSDIETKNLLRNLGMGVGIAALCVVVWLLYRYFSGKTNGGIPEPEAKLPEGKVPTHLKAIEEHKEKMKEKGISTVESD